MEVVGENSTVSLKLIPNSTINQTPPPPKPSEPHHFPTAHDAPDISSAARILCDTLTASPPDNVEVALSATGIVPTPDVVEEVLKYSYGNPSSTVKFFRWAGGGSQKYSPKAWNLMVDLLGKNQLYEPMWDAVRTMKQENVLSLNTFVSVFGSYCAAGRINEAKMSFDVMDRYGIEQDVAALNSLLSAICREGNQTSIAVEILDKVKDKVQPDVDTYAILLEGWDKEDSIVKAKNTFGEMVVCIGWTKQNMPAYETFLTMLVRGKQLEDAVDFLEVMRLRNCLPGLGFFSNAIDILTKHNDFREATILWDIMVANGLLPDLKMYNSMIGMACNNKEIDTAFRFLDEMTFHGAFPDSLTYNMIFKCLIKKNKVRRASKFFYEMVKNEWPPTHLNCVAAISLFLDGDDPETAIDIWNYMLENNILPLDESGNALLVGLRNLGRLSELRSFAEDMLDRKITLYESTMVRLKNAFDKESKSVRDAYERLEKRWKAS